MTAHQSLYRIYRPKTFAEVVGQEQVTKILEEQIAGKKVGHAYLFAGSRGLGKTSIARIFARELGTTSRDLYEIDAASNNSVDDIRALAENVYTLPYESPYKVYILDEAHMLSKGAWNAFLKTLEEPPAYVIFILATTELSKVPETVQSRCQVFQFKKPTIPVLEEFLSEVAKKEGKDIGPVLAHQIAQIAEGSYRDALSILEKISSSEMSSQEAEVIVGATSYILVGDVVRALHEGISDKALKTIRTAAEHGADMTQFLADMLGYVRNVLLIRYASELHTEIEEEVGSDRYSEMKDMAQDRGSKLSHKTLLALLDASERVRFSPIPSLPLELAVLELIEEETTGKEMNEKKGSA